MKYLGTTILMLFLALPAAARADFTLSYGQQTAAVPASVTASWLGSATLTTPSVFSEPLSAGRLLQQYAGGAAPGGAEDVRYSSFNPAAVFVYLKTLAGQINRPVQEPAITINNNRVTAFTPPADGMELDLYHSAMDVVAALNAGEPGAILDIATTQPKLSLNSLNSLGINTLIARGSSNFAGSPGNRRHNIAVGIQKFQGLLVAPGQEFSFDDNLGPVTAEAGFLPELVIDNGTTLPELGGGLCQVSTTTFRAAMAAGLPITDRRNHAYAVSYYSPQGTDATIYPGSADLKFINNTPGYILIWPYETDKNNLNFDFWGTGDGRKVTLEKPITYDRQSNGALKASWTRDINMNSTTTSQTFYSTYQPPALFHKTETFVSATGTPIKTN